MKQKKPTNNEIKTVINNMLIEISQMSSFIQGLDTSFAAYLEMKGEDKKLNDFITKKIKEAKDAQQEQSKGNRFEREIVNIAKDRGFESQRAWGSNGQALGMHEEVDLTLGINPKLKIQAKCRKSIASYLIPTEHVDAVVCKEDRGEPLIIMRFSEWLDMHWGNCMVEDK